MVGVPGRSKGCHTCRKRKIACSLERPYCLQCVKSSRVCAGYQRDRVFIINDLSTETRKGALVKSSSALAMPFNGNEKPKNCTQPASRNADESWTSNTEVHWSVLKELSPQPLWRQQLLSGFLSSQKMLEGSEGKPWLILLSQLPSPSLALEKSRMAICTARLGRMHANEALLRKSLNLYTEGLQELQKALYDPHLMYKDETLGACMSLASYELMECPAGTSTAYISHHNGCARLIELRGAKAHASGLGHEIFVAFRTQAVMNSLENHRSTYLSEKAWKTTPWKHASKNSYDELLDIIALAPDIFRRTDDFDALEPRARLRLAIEVTHDCWKVDDRLRRFYQRLEENTTGPLYWAALAKEIELSKSRARGTGAKPFPLSYHFPSLPVARTLILYWSVLCMLWAGMSRLHQLVSTLQLEVHEVEDLPSLGHRADFVVPSRNVLQSVEYLMQDKMLGLGPQSVIAPLSIVADTIKDFPQYAMDVAWALTILEEIKERGMAILGCASRMDHIK